ncbi:MAG: hypothetical protein ACREBB_00960 [Nitrosotalea sp.]
MSYLKVEILLPLYHNKGKTGRRKKIEGGIYLETFNDIMDKFGGCTIDNTPLLGGWVDPNTKKRISDENKTYWVVCKKTRENIEFFHKLKKKLKIRFEQQDIMIYYVVINKF